MFQDSATAFARWPRSPASPWWRSPSRSASGRTPRSSAWSTPSCCGRCPFASRTGWCRDHDRPAQSRAICPFSHPITRTSASRTRCSSGMAAFAFAQRQMEQRRRAGADARAGGPRQLLLAARRRAALGRAFAPKKTTKRDPGRGHQPGFWERTPRKRPAIVGKTSDAEPHAVHGHRRGAARLHRHRARRRPIRLGADVDARRRPAELHVVRAAARACSCSRSDGCTRRHGRAGDRESEDDFGQLEQAFPDENKGRSAGSVRCSSRV